MRLIGLCLKFLVLGSIFALSALPSVSAAQTFTTFNNSGWGTGRQYDLSNRIPRPVPLDSYLPLDTSGWTFRTLNAPSDCTQAAVNSAISSATGPTVIVLPDCTITITSNSDGIAFNISNSKNRLVIRGHSSGRSKLLWSPSGNPPNNGWRHNMFNRGGTPGSIATWSWNAGYTQGTSVVRSNQAISEVYPNDIVRLGITQWTDSSSAYGEYYRVVCAKWGTGATQGTGCSTEPNNTIKIDRNLPFDMTGSLYQNGAFTGHTITHVERVGGGTTTNNMAEYIGLENFAIEHSKPAAIDAFQSAIEDNSCMECWISGVKFSTPWGNSWVGNSNGASRILYISNDFVGPLWRSRCRADVTGLTASANNTAQVTLTVNSSCNNVNAQGQPFWCTNLEPGIWFPPDYPVASLAGKMAKCSCVDCDTSDNRITIALTDSATNLPISATGLPSNPGGWGMQINNYGIAGFYFSGVAGGSQVINNSFRNARVGFIQQQGGYSTVVAYNYYKTDPGNQCSRSFFIHGGPGTATLWEGNDADCGYTTYATAAQGHGVGPYFTMFRNRGRVTSANFGMNHQCPNGGICNEMTGQDGFSSDQHNILANFLGGISGGAFGHCDHDDQDSSAGCASPYQLYNPHLHKNVWHAEDIASDDLETVARNPTIVAPDEAASLNDNVLRAPNVAGWNDFAWPTSILYDSIGRAPRWWCQESGVFPNIGAPSDDLTGGAQNLSKLPAEIRMNGGNCSLVTGDSIPPVAPSNLQVTSTTP